MMRAAAFRILRVSETLDTCSWMPACAGMTVVSQRCAFDATPARRPRVAGKLYPFVAVVAITHPMTIASAALLLFLVMDPLGNVPFFLAALRFVDPARVRRVIVRELLIALAVLVLFLFTGRFILELLHISDPALTLA